MPTISPSLSNMGKLRLGTKSDKVSSCREELAPTSIDDTIADIHTGPSLGVPTVDAVILTYTCSVRGKGIHRHIESSNALPRNWQEFPRNSENKSELFYFLSLQIEKLEIEIERQIMTTYHKGVLCTQPRGTNGLAPCTQEEADTRIFLHVSDASKHAWLS